MRTEPRRAFQASSGLAARAIACTIPPLPRVIEIDPVDWDLIITGGFNALLCGPPAALEAPLFRLRVHLPTPLHAWSGSGEWSLPCVSAGTLVLEHVAACSLEQQRALLQWLDAAARPVQVITTTDRPLFDLVERGAFLESLYYRLNTVHLNFYGAI